MVNKDWPSLVAKEADRWVLLKSVVESREHVVIGRPCQVGKNVTGELEPCHSPGLILTLVRGTFSNAWSCYWLAGRSQKHYCTSLWDKDSPLLPQPESTTKHP